MLCRFPPKNKKGLKIEDGVESEIPNVSSLKLNTTISMPFLKDIR